MLKRENWYSKNLKLDFEICFVKNYDHVAGFASHLQSVRPRLNTEWPWVFSGIMIIITLCSDIYGLIMLPDHPSLALSLAFLFHFSLLQGLYSTHTANTKAPNEVSDFLCTKSTQGQKQHSFIIRHAHQYPSKRLSQMKTYPFWGNSKQPFFSLCDIFHSTSSYSAREC